MGCPSIPPEGKEWFWSLGTSPKPLHTIFLHRVEQKRLHLKPGVRGITPVAVQRVTEVTL